MTKIGDTITVHVYREEANFDKACEMSYRMALHDLRIGEDGYARGSTDLTRFRIEVRFVGYTCTAPDEHNYEFTATVTN